MVKINNLTKCSIDSLKLRIPLALLDSYDKDIVRNNAIINIDTGNIEKEFKETAKKYQFDTFKLTANIFKVNSIDCLILLVNSKQVAYDYFKGITLSTIRTIYELSISANILRCSFSTFMRANCTDTDFKKDFPCVIDEYKQMISGLSTMGLQSTKRGYGVRKQPNNLGIEFNSRDSATISKPFVKVYHKEIELQENSFDFADRYLSDINYKNIIRIESTVKDKKHFMSLLPELKDTSLDSILNLNTSQKDIIMADSFNRNLLPRAHNKVYNQEGLNQKDLYHLQILNIFVNQNKYTSDEAINKIIFTMDCKVAKSRLKKYLFKLYNDYIYQINYTEKAKNINQIYDLIGWK
tara:strand:+ start:589 stop:1644 length:1056 start_codon:yes stop_codon:yes gene_type:complete